MRIDFETMVTNPEDPDGEKQPVTTTYYMKYSQDAVKEVSKQTIYYDPEMTTMQYQSISDFSGLTESIHERNAEDDYQSCQIFQYKDKFIGIHETQNAIWAPLNKK